MQQEPDRQWRLWAIALMCGSVTLFSLLDTTAKILAVKSGLPVSQIVWVRFLGNVGLNLVMFSPLLLASMWRSPNKLVLFVRSVLMASITGLNFLALNYLQLDQTVTFFFLAPFFVAALGGPLLGEWIGIRRFMAVLVGFSGVLFVTRPGFGFHFAMTYSIGAALGYALYMLATRFLAQRQQAELAQVTAPLAGIVLFAPPALQHWVWPDGLLTWLMLLSLGLIGGLGHWLLVLAHRHAPAPILAPFTYVGLPSMILLGFFAFGDVPHPWTLLGAVIIISAGGYLLWRER